MGKPLSGNAIQLTLLNIYTIHSTRYPLVKHQCNIKSQQLNHQSAAKSARPNKIYHRRLRSSTMLQTMLQCSKLCYNAPNYATMLQTNQSNTWEQTMASENWTRRRFNRLTKGYLFLHKVQVHQGKRIDKIILSYRNWKRPDRNKQVSPN